MIRGLVSICIPTYNGSAYLSACLESALAQTYKKVEIVVVDDASQDATVDIVQSFAFKDSRVRLLSNAANAGLVGNWNRCIEAAQGEWVKFLFQDDLLHPDCVNRLVNEGVARQAKLVACLRTFIFEDGTSEDRREWYSSHYENIAALMKDGRLGADAVARHAIEKLGVNFVGEPTVSLIHRSVFHELGLFDSALAQLVDSEYWVRAGIHHGWTMVLDDLASFRVHTNSTSAHNVSQRHFTGKWLDTIVILHRFLHDPSYAPLRDVARKQGLMKAIEARFWDACHDARTIVRETEGPEGDRMHTDFARVVAAYPRLDEASLRRTLHRKLRRTCAKMKW